MPFTEAHNADKKLSQVTDELRNHAYCGSKEMKTDARYGVREFDKNLSVEKNLDFDFTDKQNIKV